MNPEIAEQISDSDCDEMARLISDGYTEGIIDRENLDGSRSRISWKLEAEIFNL